MSVEIHIDIKCYFFFCSHSFKINYTWAKGAWGYQLSQHSFIDTGLTLQWKHTLAVCQSHPSRKAFYYFSSRLLLSSRFKWIGKLKCYFAFSASKGKKKRTNLKQGNQQHINFVNHYWHNIQFYLYANIDLFLKMCFSSMSTKNMKH